MKKTDMQTKKSEFIAALVNKFGENKVVSRKEIHSFWKTSGFPWTAASAVIKSQDYKVARGQYVITSNSKPKTVASKIVVTKEKNILPKEVRQSPAKLVKQILAEPTQPKKAVAPKKNALGSEIVQKSDMGELFGSDDINDIMRYEV
jgi:hypothetical protein